MKAIIRKEVHLDPLTVKQLTKCAKKNKISLKKYMETILTEIAQADKEIDKWPKS